MQLPGAMIGGGSNLLGTGLNFPGTSPPPEWLGALGPFFNLGMMFAPQAMSGLFGSRSSIFGSMFGPYNAYDVMRNQATLAGIRQTMALSASEDYFRISQRMQAVGFSVPTASNAAANLQTVLNFAAPMAFMDPSIRTSSLAGAAIGTQLLSAQIFNVGQGLYGVRPEAAAQMGRAMASYFEPGGLPNVLRTRGATLGQIGDLYGELVARGAVAPAPILMPGTAGFQTQLGRIAAETGVPLARLETMASGTGTDRDQLMRAISQFQTRGVSTRMADLLGAIEQVRDIFGGANAPMEKLLRGLESITDSARNITPQRMTQTATRMRELASTLNRPISEIASAMQFGGDVAWQMGMPRISGVEAMQGAMATMIGQRAGFAARGGAAPEIFAISDQELQTRLMHQQLGGTTSDVGRRLGVLMTRFQAAERLGVRGPAMNAVRDIINNATSSNAAGSERARSMLMSGEAARLAVQAGLVSSTMAFETIAESSLEATRSGPALARAMAGMNVGEHVEMMVRGVPAMRSAYALAMSQLTGRQFNGREVEGRLAAAVQTMLRAAPGDAAQIEALVGFLGDEARLSDAARQNPARQRELQMRAGELQSLILSKYPGGTAGFQTDRSVVASASGAGVAASTAFAAREAIRGIVAETPLGKEGMIQRVLRATMAPGENMFQTIGSVFGFQPIYDTAQRFGVGRLKKVAQSVGFEGAPQYDRMVTWIAAKMLDPATDEETRAKLAAGMHELGSTGVGGLVTGVALLKEYARVAPTMSDAMRDETKKLLQSYGLDFGYVAARETLDELELGQKTLRSARDSILNEKSDTDSRAWALRQAGEFATSLMNMTYTEKGEIQPGLNPALSDKARSQRLGAYADMQASYKALQRVIKKQESGAAVTPEEWLIASRAAGALGEGLGASGVSAEKLSKMQQLLGGKDLSSAEAFREATRVELTDTLGALKEALDAHTPEAFEHVNKMLQGYGAEVFERVEDPQRAERLKRAASYLSGVPRELRAGRGDMSIADLHLREMQQFLGNELTSSITSLQPSKASEGREPRAGKVEVVNSDNKPLKVEIGNIDELADAIRVSNGF